MPPEILNQSGRKDIQWYRFWEEMNSLPRLNYNLLRHRNADEQTRYEVSAYEIAIIANFQNMNIF